MFGREKYIGPSMAVYCFGVLAVHKTKEVLQLKIEDVSYPTPWERLFTSMALSIEKIPVLKFYKGFYIPLLFALIYYKYWSSSFINSWIYLVNSLNNFLITRTLVTQNM